MNSLKSGMLVACVLTIFLSGASALAENGVTESEILLGQSTALSGQPAARSLGIEAGFKVYFDKINSEGGVFGRKIRLVTYEDHYEPKEAADNAHQLLEKDKVFALFKFYGTQPSKAVLPLVEKMDVPYLFPASPAEFLRNPVNRNIFNVRTGARDEAEALISFLVDKLGIKEIGILYQDDAFGSDGRNLVLNILKDRNLPLTVQASYPRGTVNLEQAFKTIQKAAPKAVILWTLADAGVKFVNLAKENGFKPVIAAHSGLMAPVLLEGVGDTHPDFYIASGIPLTDDDSLEITKRFNRDAKAASVSTDSSSFEGYLDAVVLVEALKQAGKNLTRETLRQAFEQKMRNFDLGGLPVSMSPTHHQALSRIFLIQLKGKHLTSAK